MAPFATSIRWFRDIWLDDVAVVGGKNASLGELYSVLSEQGVRVPNGFALTADAYRRIGTLCRSRMGSRFLTFIEKDTKRFPGHPRMGIRPVWL